MLDPSCHSLNLTCFPEFTLLAGEVFAWKPRIMALTKDDERIGKVLRKKFPNKLDSVAVRIQIEG